MAIALRHRHRSAYTCAGWWQTASQPSAHRTCVGLSVFRLHLRAHTLWGRDAWLGLPHVIAGFDKAILPVPRLLDILALAWPLASVPVYSNLAKIGPNYPLAIHSLPVFILGIVSAMVAQVVKALQTTTLRDDAGLICTGIARRSSCWFMGWSGYRARRALRRHRERN